MIGLLTWPAYGTWLPGRARGWIDPNESLGVEAIPEPDHEISVSRRGELPWPRVRLDVAQRSLVVADIDRIAKLRDFVPRIGVAAIDHVHVLLEIEADRAIPRLVQLVKGSLSRTLSIAAGDPPARSPTRAALPHHKWWTHQYSFRIAPARDVADAVARKLMEHEAAGGVVRSVWPLRSPASSPPSSG